MDLRFIRRSIGTTLALTGLAFLALLSLGRPVWAWGVGMGSVWACLNWILISGLVERLLTNKRKLSRRSKIRLGVLLLIKFPVLYGAGYLLLRLGFPVPALLAGFWIILGVVVAKAAGRLILGMDPIPLAGGAGRSEGQSP
jgi:hypothetical protein